MQRLDVIYNSYALLVGVTSYRLVNGKLLQTRVTRIYALVANIIYLAVLPIGLWKNARIISRDKLLPKFIEMSPFALHFVIYVVVFIILSSRCFWERLLLDSQRLNIQLNRKMTRSGKCASSRLRRILILKKFSFAFLWLGNFITVLVFWLWTRYDRSMLFGDLLITCGLNMMVMCAYFHFVTFWNIARGYEFVNQRMDDLIPALKPHTWLEKKEIYHLWAMHLKLGRIAQRLQRVCGLQMLAWRLNYFLRTIILGFYYLIYLNHTKNSTPAYVKYYVSITCFVQSVGFFLNDYIVELASEYQSKPKDTIIEGIMTKETSSYVIYVNSSKLQLWSCGLFQVNRSMWFDMMSSILYYILVLLQFHFVMET
ncbi:hypothetical protein KR084_000101 [Drosophila pseudotakahashii]|nr:hypothetical protein KR084_000101 [Drosophila pseudotakahashii]